MKPRGRLSIATLLLTLALCLPLCLPAPARAADKDWNFSIAPYGWLAGVSGSASIRNRGITFSSGFSEIAQYLNFAAMVHAEAVYNDKIGIIADFVDVFMSGGKSGSMASLTANSGLIIFDADAFYRVGSLPLGQGSSTATLDILAGARMWSLSFGLDLSAFGLSRDDRTQKTWVDPIVGARVIFKLPANWFLSLRGAVGGFGVNSGFTWDAVAVLGYAFNEYISAVAGYKAIGLSYKQDAFKLDSTLCGPVLGVNISF